MTQDSPFHFSFDSTLDDFDPLDSFEGSDDDDTEGFQVPSVEESIPVSKNIVETFADPALPAEERTASLFENMPTRKLVLFGILEFCKEPRQVSEVNEHIDLLQRSSMSVFTAADLTHLLEQAGSIERISSQGTTIVEEAQCPETVVIDGVEYLQPSVPEVSYWKTTEAGLKMLATNQPLNRTKKLFEDERNYLPIYKRILTLASREGGAATALITKAVDSDALLQNPRYFSPRFVERLEKCQTLIWDGAWKTTELGERCLEDLGEVEDELSKNIAEGLWPGDSTQDPEGVSEPIYDDYYDTCEG